ncbi:MAG: DUF4349 domain-containing protein [Spirochaetes bacterium]|nr:DUF4349 domain-containing protein [Spirochaetota bacterium]
MKSRWRTFVSRALPAAVCVVLVTALFSCKKAEKAQMEEAEAPMAMKSEAVMDKAAVRDVMPGSPEGGAANAVRRSGPGLVGHFITPAELASGRLLEYRVELSYESDDLMKSRRELLEATARHGYVKESTSSMEGKHPFVTSEIRVRSERLYDALRDFDRVGTLKTERITVTDHTEGMMLQERAARREQVRITRRGAASAGTAPTAKNWKDIEDALEESENRLDASEQEKWRIKDRVAWASVRVEITGPDLPERIVVPPFGDALVDLANILLGLVYGLVYLVPLGILVAAVVWNRKRIAALFRGRKKAE